MTEKAARSVRILQRKKKRGYIEEFEERTVQKDDMESQKDGREACG